jgi:hypothetical protein
MAQTKRKTVYITPQHHNVLRRIAYEQHCNLSDVLDVVLDQVDWNMIAIKAKEKPLQRAAEKKESYNIGQ